MNAFDRIDAHQHFWKYEPAAFSWIEPDQYVLQRDFMPDDLIAEMKKAGYHYSVAVQARSSTEETRWLLALSDQYPSILGVVGWVDLLSEKLHDQLTAFSAYERFKGVRHVVQDESDDQFLLSTSFLDGITLLREFKLVYDLLIYPRQLSAAVEFASRFPRQRIVLDHLAKPDIRSRQFEPWASHMKDLATLPNVVVKISGLITEADHKAWKPSDIWPYLEFAWEQFGENRLIFGSDWPVCRLAGSYAQVSCLAEGFFEQFPQSVQKKVFADNARRIYLL